MTFIQFISSLPKQGGDKHTNSFLDFAKKNKEFLGGSDFDAMAKVLYNKIDPDLTAAYQKLLMLYISFGKDGDLKHLANNQMKSLDLINTIIELQNNDPAYLKIYRPYMLK